MPSLMGNSTGGLSGFSTKVLNKKMCLVFCIYCRSQVTAEMSNLLKVYSCSRGKEVIKR